MAIIDLHKLSPEKTTNIAYIIVGCIVAPFFFLFQFAKPIFNKYDLLTVIILSFGVGAPISLLFALLRSFVEDYLNKIMDYGQSEPIALVGYSSMHTGIVLYTVCAMSYFAPLTQAKAIHYSILWSFVFFAAFNAGQIGAALHGKTPMNKNT
jgi:hypothetical protein